MILSWVFVLRSFNPEKFMLIIFGRTLFLKSELIKTSPLFLLEYLIIYIYQNYKPRTRCDEVILNFKKTHF